MFYHRLKWSTITIYLLHNWQTIYNSRARSSVCLLCLFTGGLMLLVEDMAVCEAAEQTTFQPHDISQESENQGNPCSVVCLQMSS